jgi:co-chaperonin GroES (HSP10)
MGPQAFKEAEMRDVQVTEGTTVITERSGRPWVSVGDYVMFQRYNGYRIPDPTTQSGYNEELVFVLDTDIICILEKDKEDEA